MKCNKCRVKKDINEFDINNKNGFYYKGALNVVKKILRTRLKK